MPRVVLVFLVFKFLYTLKCITVTIVYSKLLWSLDSCIFSIVGVGGGLSSGAIAGIVIGVLVAVAGICGLIVYLTKTHKM